jgi:NAD(P)-dependent dehydrogenase (short-subunit alcohol dehydrogenase family)
MDVLSIVSGGTRGIGLSIVEKFASEGMKVRTCGRNKQDVDALNELSAVKYNGRIMAVVADLSARDGVLEFADKLGLKKDEVNILVNNAGTFKPGKILEEPDGLFEQQMSINLNSAYYLTRVVFPFVNQKDAYIFNICSVAGLKAYPNGGSYCISKHGFRSARWST